MTYCKHGKKVIETPKATIRHLDDCKRDCEWCECVCHAKQHRCLSCEECMPRLCKLLDESNAEGASAREKEIVGMIDDMPKTTVYFCHDCKRWIGAPHLHDADHNTETIRVIAQEDLKKKIGDKSA